VRTYSGASDASAAEFLDETTLAVADDEDNVLRLYDAAAGGPPRQALDLSAFLGLSPDEESDIEGAARVGDRIYWITSHGPKRQLLFATEITRSEAGVGLRPVGRPCREIGPAILRLKAAAPFPALPAARSPAGAPPRRRA
jgi:hypothetical protein